MIRFLLVVVTVSLVAQHLHAKPNVVVFLTDDQGWGDLSINGNTNLQTPHIDSLGHDGAVLNNYYVCAVCAPTRAEFLTGRYYARTGVSGVSQGQERLNPDETTLADIFKKAGYRTGAFGKWHNGTQSPYHPNDRGFDEFYGFTAGHWGAYYSPPLDHNGTTVRGIGYVVDDFTERAIQFITANQENDFFCYIPYNTPHSPMFIDDPFFKKFAELDPSMKRVASGKEDIPMTRAALAMVENIDWNVGRVLATLDKLNLANDTIVIFFSDNGPNSFRWNGNMKGKKGHIDEGGIRSPCLVRWPGKIDKGKPIEKVLGGLDWLPTLAELCGIDYQTNRPIDGQSFANLLTGNLSDQLAPERYLYSLRKNQVSVRSQRFRLDANGKLFDILNDRAQTTDIAKQFPAFTRAMQAAADQFKSEIQKDLEKNRDRPFTIGYGHSNRLTARDGVENGSVQRSSKSPNNSFFENWTGLDGYITWDIEVAKDATFEAIVYYTCREQDVGAVIALEGKDTKNRVTAKVTEAFNPPLYDKTKERVEKSHYFVKDFRPLKLGAISLKAGRQKLKLSAREMVGTEVIDIHSIDLIEVKLDFAPYEENSP